MNQQILADADEFDSEFSSQKIRLEMNGQEMSVFKAQLSEEQKKYLALFTEYETSEKKSRSLSI